MILEKYFKFGEMARSVATLSTGTILAQLIIIIGSPLLTRLYSPKDFGEFGLYFATVSILSVVSSGRYELSILLPIQSKKSLNIVALCLLISILVCCLLSIVVFFLKTNINNFPQIRGAVAWVTFLPLGIFFMGAYNVFYYWSIRSKAFKLMAISRIISSFFMVGMQVVLGVFGGGVVSMIVALIFGQFVSAMILAVAMIVKNKGKLKFITVKAIAQSARRYKSFPKFMLPGHILNALSADLPLYLLSIFFGTVTSGFYMLMNRVLASPTSIVGSAIADVFRQRASQEYAINKQCRSVYLKTLQGLLLLSILPFTILLFFSPVIFKVVFGPNWIIAGEYAQIMTLMFFLSFVTAPLSSLFMVVEKQKLDFIWQVFRVILSFASIAAGFILFKSVKVSLMLFTLSFSLLYVINAIMAFYFSGGRK
ncbi:conserved membrane hypothetical protein [Gammaproteobacteria bacterium]